MLIVKNHGQSLVLLPSEREQDGSNVNRAYYAKKIVISIFLIMAAANINAETLLDISWNFGSGGFGVLYSPENDGAMELSVSVLNLIIEEKYRSIGFEFSPAKYWHLFELQEEFVTKYDGVQWSFINIKLYWNVLYDAKLMLGPFTAVNYMYISELNGFTPNTYSFSAGLDFLLRYRIKSYSFQIGAEAGYRNITGEHAVYVLVKGDIVPALVGILMGMAEEQRDKSRNGTGDDF